MLDDDPRWGCLWTVTLFVLAVIYVVFGQKIIDELGGGSTAVSTTVPAVAAGADPSGGESLDESAIVEAYCSRAVSDAQYEGCIDHVTVGDIYDTDSPLARQVLKDAQPIPAHP